MMSLTLNTGRRSAARRFTSARNSLLARGLIAVLLGLPLSVGLTTEAAAQAGVTITETGGNTRPIEGGTTDRYGMVLDTQPTSDVTITATSGTPGTATVNPTSLIFTNANWNMAQSITVTGVNNAADAANQAVTITHAATSSDTNYNLTPAPVTATVIDDEPTVVTLTRFGGTGAISEGDLVAFLVNLSRPLTASETIDVPLSVGGTGVTTADWRLEPAIGDGLNTGVTLSGQTTAIPQVSFSGLGAQTAILTLTPANDDTAEGDGFETYTIALGPDGDGANGFDRSTLGTNVGGGADPSSTTNSFDVRVNDPPPPGVTITETDGGTTPIEGGTTDSYGMTLDTQPTADVTITAISSTGATVNPGSLVFTSTNWNMAQTITVTGVNNDDDAANREVTIAHLALSSDTRYNGLTPAPFTATVIDDDPTVVSLTRFSVASTISEGGEITIVVTLSRRLAAGETIDVPLSIGGTGVTTADWSLGFSTVTPNTGVTLSAATTPTPQVSLSGLDVQGAILILTSAEDDTAEGDGFETYTIALGPDGGGANGFDRSTLNTNVGGGADPDSSANSLDVRVNDPVDVIITQTGGTTAPIEGGTTDNYGMTLDTQPTADVTITATSGTPGTATVSGSLTFTSANWNMAQSITVTGVDNNADAANQAVTITHAATSTDTRYNSLTPDPVTATVIDDDPTVVSLGRIGGTTITEGGEISILVSLSRPLTDSETIDVPLSIGGTGVTPADWGLAAGTAGGLNTGVTLSAATTPTPQVTFSGAGAQNAVLALTPADDDTAEGDGFETYAIALGPNDATTNGFDRSTLNTNVGGGADPSGSANSFDLRVNDPPPASVTITQTGGNTRPIEGGTTDNYGMTLDTQPTADVTITATSGTPTTATVNPGSLVFTSTNWNMAQSITVTGVDNDDDAVNQAVTISHAATSTDTDYNLTPASVTATVIDDDPTTVTLAGAESDILAGDDKQITVTLGRGLVNGEILPVPLTFGGSATPGTDYTVTGAAATGITYTGLGGAVGTVTFTGPASGTTATTATLTLSAVNAGVTVDIDLGTLDADSGTGLEGGADGTDNLADFDIVTPGVTVTETQGGTTVAEAGGTDNYGIRLSTQPTGSVTITATSNTTSAATVTPTTLTFTTANWNAAQTFTVTGIDNNRDDAMNRRIATISHAAASTDTDYGSSLDIDDVEATVTDDDVPVVTVSVRDGHTTLVENGDQRTIVVTSDIPIDGLVSYGSPILFDDLFVETVNTFLTGETPMQTIRVVFDRPDENNMDDPPGRTVTTGINAGSGVTPGDPSTVIFTVIDDDPTTVTLGGTAGNINEGASADITVTLGRELVSGEVLPVPLTLGGTATRGTDYTLTGTAANNIAYNIPDTGNMGTVTFTGPAPATATLTLTVQIDTTSDASETIDIDLGTLDADSGTNLEGGADGTDSLTDFTIMEQPTIALRPSTLTVEEGDSASYSVVLATAPTMSTTIAVTGDSGTDLMLDTASLEFTMSNWDTAQMVTVTAGEDDDADTDEVTLMHTATGGNYDALTAVIRVSITDPDIAAITISETAITITEGDEGTYTVVLATQPSAAVTITPTSGTLATATVSPSALTFTSANWNTVQTITVAGEDNNADAANQEVTITHAATSTDARYNRLTPDSVTATVIDDEPTTVTLAGASGDITEGGTKEITVTLSRGLVAGESLTVQLTFGGMARPERPRLGVSNNLLVDYSLSIADATGVTFSSPDQRNRGSVTFTGPSSGTTATTATLTLSAQTTETRPADGETVDISLGTLNSNSGTGLGGGASGTDNLDIFTIMGPQVPAIVLPPTLTVTEGDSVGYPVSLATAPTGAVTVTVTGHSSTDLTPDATSLTFTMTDWDTVQTVMVSAAEDADAADDTVTLTHTASGTTAYSGITGAVVVTIDDDDLPVASFAMTSFTTGEGSGTYNVAVNLTPAPAVATTITYTVGGTATPGTDYTTLTGTVVASVDASSVNIPVAITDDSMTETSETVILNLTAGSGYTLGTDRVHTLTIADNDTAGVTVSEARITVAEPAGEDMYTVVLNTQPAGDVEITVASDTTSAATVSPASLTFAAGNWNRVQTVTVTGVNDNVGGNRTATISHSIASGDGDGAGYPDGLAIATVAVTVTDDDEPVASFAAASFTTNEGSGTYNVVVDLSPAPAVATTITYTVAGTSTASMNTDYTALTGTVMASASASSVEIPVIITDDSTQEGSETVILILGTGTGYTVGTGRVHTLTITDNDLPVASFAAGTSMANEGSGTHNVVVNLSPAPTAATTIMYTVATGSANLATPGDDYTALTGMVVVAANMTSANIPVAITNDSADETSETIGLTLGVRPGVYGSGSPDVHTLTITDNDATTVTLAGASGDITEGDTRAITVTLGRGLEDGEILPVPLTFGGSATPGTDYTVTGATATGVAYSGLNSASAMVTFTGPSSGMTATTATLTLSAVNAGTVDIDLGTLDGDSGTGLGGGADGTDNLDAFDIVAASAGVTVSEASLTVAENAMGTYTLVLNTQPAGNVVITVESGTTSAATVSAASLTFAAGNWNTAQTVTVTGVNDSVVGDRTATISHSIESGDGDGAGYPDGLAIDTVAVTVTDDDVPVASFAVPGFTTNEGSGTYNVVVNLSPVPAANTTITYTVAGTATPDTDYTELTGTVVASASASSVNIPVAITDDSTQEGSETVILTLAAGSGYTVGTDRVHTLTIADNDPGVIVSDARVTVAEPDGTDIYTLVLNTRPAGDVEITVESNMTSAATVAPLSLTFTAGNWSTAQTVTVTGVNDNVGGNGNRTAIISHSIDSGDGDGAGYPDGLAIATVAVTVTDDVAVGTGAMQAAQEAWLPRFGLTAIEHLLGGLDYRFSVADQPGLSGNVSGLSAGRALHGGGNATGTGYGLGTDGFGQGGGGGDGLGAGSVDRLLNLSRTLSLRDMLRGSRFVHRGGENGVSVWGQASYSRYEDGQDGITVDGDVTTGMLGVDRDNGRTLLGLALSYSDGDGDWSGTSAQGELSSTLTSLLPYIRHNVTQRLQVWAAASYGRGELEQTLEQTSATMSTEHDIEQRSASAGVRGILLERPMEEGGLTLTLISDAALARIESDDADGVSGMSADTERFRMGLEWSWQLPQADGGRLIPELELGMRYDGGDTSDGLGVELGGGISWQLPSKGLTIDLRGRRLLDHEADERREWGVSGSLRYDRQPGSAHGPSLSLRQEYGTAPASGGLDRLLSDSLSDALEEDSSQPGPASGRWSLEGEWGLALKDGATGIPYAGLSSSDSGYDLTLGWRLLSAPGDLDTELDVKALRRRDGEGKTNHGIGAQWKLRW